MWALPMSSRLLAAAAAAAMIVAAGIGPAPEGARAAEPARATPALADKKPAPSCGELPRGSRAYRDCLAAQSRRDAAASGQPTVKPVFSSR
jgi:hypothetical protein